MGDKIFVEGKHDKEFLEIYLHLLECVGIEIISCEGNSLENIHSKIQETKDNGEKSLLIFDADNDFKTTLARLKTESKGLLREEDIFLFPNNSQNGELEKLLFDIAKEKEICQCFEQYKKCIEKHKPEYRENIHKKSARFAYFEALGFSSSLNSKDTQERREAYPKIFDLTSSHLKALRDFLETHLKTKESSKKIENLPQR